MGTGYTRKDTVNNIADGNIINAADLDLEFDGVEAAFDAATGHTHDGTTGEGAPIEVTGPAQEYVSTGTELRPKTNNTYDLGSASLQWKDLYVDGTANLDTVDIDAGAIDGTVIGGATPAAGTFTTLTATGNVTLGDAATDTVTITADVASNIIPSADNTYDLGASGSEWKDLYIDGTANIDSLVADTADINGGTIDGVTIGGASAGAGTFTNVTATGTINLSGATVSNGGTVTTVDINGGTIDGTVIGGSTPAAISGTTGQFGTSLNVDGTVTADGLTVDGGATFNLSSAQAVSIFRSPDFATLKIGEDASNNFELHESGNDFFIRETDNSVTKSRIKLSAGGDISFYEDTGTTPKFFWDASAEALGIGTSSPSSFSSAAQDLVVGSTTGSHGITIQSQNVSNGNIYFTDTTGTNYNGFVRYYHGDNALAFGTNDGTERMRIDSSGNVGIGTSSPADRLHVYSSTTLDHIRIDGPAGINRNLNFSTGALNRWNVYATGAAESGSNVGSDFNIARYDDAGVFIGAALTITRSSGAVSIAGSLSKGSGSFKIDHPIKPETHHLVHSFIEGPQADNLYRGKVALVEGTATVNLDEAGRMTEGTFVALNGNVQCFTTNEDGWTAVRGKVEGNILTIEAQDAACTDTVSWLVIGERHDQHMIDANWTDDQGRIITEPAK